MARRVRRAKLCKWVLKGQPVFLTTNSTGSYDSINLSSCISRPTCLSLLGGGPGLVMVSVCPVLDEQRAGRCLWSSMGQLGQWVGAGTRALPSAPGAGLDPHSGAPSAPCRHCHGSCQGPAVPQASADRLGAYRAPSPAHPLPLSHCKAQASLKNWFGFAQCWFCWRGRRPCCCCCYVLRWLSTAASHSRR